MPTNFLTFAAMQPFMGEEYYILEDGVKRGPFTFKELIQQSIGLDTQVLAPGMDTWQSASYLPQFSEYFASLGYLFPTEDNLASPLFRSLAFIIDYFILSIITGFVIIETGLLKLGDAAKFDPKTFIENLSSRDMLMIELSFVAVFLIYNVIFEIGGMRGSLGKRLCGLKVVDADGQSLTFVKALLRNIGAVTSYNIFGMVITAVSFFIGSHHQTWYERLTKVYVIKVV